MRTLAAAVKSELFSERGAKAVSSMMVAKVSSDYYRYHADAHTGSVDASGLDDSRHNGQYEGRLHFLTLPQDKKDGVSETALIMDNSDGAVSAWALSTANRIDVWQWYVFSKPPPAPPARAQFTKADIILGPFRYETVRAHPDEATGLITIRMEHMKLLREPFPAVRFDPARFPGIF